MPESTSFSVPSVKAFSKDKADIQLTQKHFQDFNDFNKFVESQGHKGDPQLDHNPALRNQLLTDFKKANPNTSFDYSILGKLQDVLQNSKTNAISEIKSGKAAFANGVNPDNILKNISKTDSIYGQKTSSYNIPGSFLTTTQLDANNKVLNRVINNTGFAGNPALQAAIGGNKTADNLYPIYADDSNKGNPIGFSQYKLTPEIIANIRLKNKK